MPCWINHNRASRPDRTGYWLAAGMLGGFIVMTGPVAAQPAMLADDTRIEGDVLARNEAVRNLVREEFDAIGIDLGKALGMNTPVASFNLRPQFSSRIVYDDNVFRAEEDRAGDFFMRLRPELELRSEWLNNEMRTTFFLERDSYFEEETNNSTDFFLDYAGRYDIADNDSLNMIGRVGRGHELRSDPNSPDGTENVNTFFTAALSLEGRFSLSDLLIEPLFDLRYFDFNNNGTIFNDDRDRTELSLGGRLGYRLREGVAIFGQATFDARQYNQKIDNDGFARDATGYDVRAVLRFEPSGVTYIDASVGYFRLNVDDPLLADVDGLGINGALTWNPSAVSTVRLDLGRQVQETTLPAITSIDTVSVSGAIDYETMYETILTIGGGYTRQDFEGSTRRDDIYSANALMTYFVNRYLMLEASYVHSRRQSTAPLADFVSNRVFLRLRTQI